VVCRPSFILEQELLISEDMPSPCIARGYFYCDTSKNGRVPQVLPRL